MPRQVSGEPYYRLTLDEAGEMYGGDDVVIVDVRRMDEYLEGHVKDAIFITVDDILARIDELQQIIRTTSFATDAAHLETAERVAFHQRPGAGAVDVEVAHGEASLGLFDACR